MNQVVADKYNIAWFKLADCVARGEKERALGVFRLLSHSFDDPALARQLHGDLLLSFRDERAQEKYEEAVTALERVRLVFSAYDEWLTKSYLKLGECYTKLEQFDKAKEMYRAVLSKHRGNVFGQEAQNKLRELQ